MNKIKYLVIISMLTIRFLNAEVIDDTILINSTNHNESLNMLNVISDANKAIEKKDYRIISTEGVGIAGITIIEGIEYDYFNEFSYPFPKKTEIGGGCSLDEEYGNKRKYARKYNRYMFSYLLKNKLIETLEVDNEIFKNLQKNKKIINNKYK